MKFRQVSKVSAVLEAIAVASFVWFLLGLDISATAKTIWLIFTTLFAVGTIERVRGAWTGVADKERGA